MFIPSTFKRPVSSWKALNLRKTLLMASSVRLKPLNCSRLPCVYAQETLTFLDRKSGSAGMPRPISYAVICLKKKITYSLSMVHLLLVSSVIILFLFFLFYVSTTTVIYTLSLHDALPISRQHSNGLSHHGRR